MVYAINLESLGYSNCKKIKQSTNIVYLILEIRWTENTGGENIVVAGSTFLYSGIKCCEVENFI
jgi:hypothetical protein